MLSFRTFVVCLIAFQFTIKEYSWGLTVQAEAETIDAILEKEFTPEFTSEVRAKSPSKKVLKRLNKLIKRESRRRTKKPKALKKMEKKINFAKKIHRKQLKRLMKNDKKRRRFYEKFVRSEGVYTLEGFERQLHKNYRTLDEYYSNMTKKLRWKLHNSQNYLEYLKTLKKELLSGGEPDVFFLVKKGSKNQVRSLAQNEKRATKALWIAIMIVLGLGSILAVTLFGFGMTIGVLVMGSFILLAIARDNRHSADSLEDIDEKSDRYDPELKKLINKDEEQTNHQSL